MIMNHMIQLVKQVSGRLHSESLPGQTDPGKIAYMRELQRELRTKDVLEVSFDELNVVVFDLETTGFFPYKGDRIISIGAVKMQGARISEEETFYSPVYSEVPLSEEIERLTGITRESLEGAEPIQDVLKKFYQFTKNDMLVAHHANHEKQFMKHATWLALKKSFQHRIIDTTFLTKVIDPELNLVTLDECCAHYDIKIKERHHALQDAMVTAELWSKSVCAIKELGFSNLKEVYTEIATLK